MRRSLIVLATVALASTVSACGDGAPAVSPPSRASSPAIVAPSRDMTPSSDDPVVPSQESPASASAPETASPAPSSTSSGGAPSAGTPSPSQPLGNATACGDVHFDSTSDNAAWDIAATGIPCADAIALVKKVGQQHNFVSGPRAFTVDGWACTVRTTEEGLPQGTYGCRKDPALVAWDRT